MNELSDAYVAAAGPDKDRIEAAVLSINALLAKDPDGLGESRGPNRRVWFAGLLMVAFDIDAIGVVVTRVRRMRD